MAKLSGAKKAAFLKRMADGRARASRLVTGATVSKAKKRAPSKKRAGRAASKLPAVLPKRKGHARGAIGKGSLEVRQVRIEHAVMDLARVNKVLVDKVVDHEKRLTSVEHTLSVWVKGRRK